MMSDKVGDQQHDLSPYELLRLKKIRRNAARMEALGLGSSIAVIAGAKPKAKVQQRKKRQRSKEATDRPKSNPTRFSKRLRDQKEKDTTSGSAVHDRTSRHDTIDDIEEAAPYVIDYTHLPQEPEQLDDDEFQVYASLRAWRLRRKNELQVEPYKICQNRTLCELIRRVRNDKSWGCACATDDGNDGSKKRNEDEVAADLIQCWGLGPTKVAAGGFGWEMMSVIAEENNLRLLDASRARTSTSTASASISHGKVIS